MKLFSSKKRVAAIGAVTALTLGVGGVAVAYWTTTGSGQGTATTGSSTGWSVSVASTSTGNLAPTTLAGTPVQNVTYSITNSGTGQQKLTQAVVSVASVTTGTGSGPACAVTDFSVGGATAGDPYTQTIDATYAVGAPPYNGTVALRLIDNGANQDNCKGQTVTLQVDAS